MLGIDVGLRNNYRAEPMGISSPTGVSPDPEQPVFAQRKTTELNPHPWNSVIYGEAEDVSELISLIRTSGWIKPLVITPTGTIISGHRRWKGALKLGLETVPVEIREFADEIAELQALLLENANRFKTTEHKVREAQAWKGVEEALAKKRMSEAGSKSAPGRPADSQEKGVENFPHLSPSSTSGKTRDAIASRVGLGSGRTYSKAAKVVEAIDKETSAGNLETAQALRQVLNSKSVNAAVKLLHPNTKKAVPAPSNTASPQRSCWNCQHRGELIENHSFYCNRLGVQGLLDKSADARGVECVLWSYQEYDSDEANNRTQPAHETFILTLPKHLQPLIQDAARTLGMSLVDWATLVLESEAIAAVPPKDKAQYQAVQCRSP